VLQVRLLGGVAAERDGEQLLLPPPIGRLLALLALRPGPHDREVVAALLWPRTAGPAARANLRTAVWALRRAIGNDALIASRTAVGLHPDAVTVDLADWRRRAAAGDAAAAAATLCHSEAHPRAGSARDRRARLARRDASPFPITRTRRSPISTSELSRCLDGETASAADIF
jgi:DNA-binding SARP family transcriptional activator